MEIGTTVKFKRESVVFTGIVETVSGNGEVFGIKLTGDERKRYVRVLQAAGYGAPAKWDGIVLKLKRDVHKVRRSTVNAE